MRLHRHIALLIVLVAMLAGTIPLVQLALDWYEVYGYAEDAGAGIQSTARGSDWIEWEEMDGKITAEYVFPRGPGARAGLRKGDEFFMLEYQQYFDEEGLRNAIAFIRPGQARSYLVIRDGEYVEANVRFTRSPTFLYPRSLALWQFALWGFTLGAFFHILGLFIIGPLAAHSRKARFELLVIAVSSLWIVGNLLRLLGIELFGPADVNTLYDHLFQGLTFVGMLGWVGFPVLLLHKVFDEVREAGIVGKLYLLSYTVPLMLLIAIVATVVFGHLGPITLEALLIPILFYASCYIAAAALIVVLSYYLKGDFAEQILGEWGRSGSIIILVFAVVVALAVMRVVPILMNLSDTMSGWVIVCAQLLAVAPVTLFSLGTLRHGKVDEVLTRAFVYVLALGLIFFAFIGGVSLMSPSLARLGSSRVVVEGLYVVVLLFLFERLARRLRIVASSFFAPERYQARKKLNQFQAGMTDILDIEVLAQRTARVLGEVFKTKSAIVFLPSLTQDNAWVTGQFHPEPPYLTNAVFTTLWPFFRDNPCVWARNPELNDNPLPEDLALLMRRHRVALAVPIKGESESKGLLILGQKTRRRAVFNLEDMDRLRSLGGQLALAVERLALVERERQLAKESTNAQLVALRAQINPHFLFNALNTILSLIEEQADEAEKVVENLASIFRYTLQAGGKSFVSMEDEFNLVEQYLAIEKARFGDRLKIDCRMAPELASFPVPAFAIQTLVENAIKHGLEKRRDRGTLTISCTPLPDGGASVLVADSGVGIPVLFGRKQPSAGIGDFFGLGLTNVASRLAAHYGRDDLIRIESDPESGTRVTLEIPANTGR